MARKTQISKQIILHAALDILIEKGYDAVNIKTISEKIGCSTQPIVWHFNNMEGLRKALACHALTYANDKLRPNFDKNSNPFLQIGHAYIDLAVNEPNLFQFLYMSGSSNLSLENFDGLLKDDGNDRLIQALSERLAISKLQAGRYLQDTIIYTHGIATLIVAGVIKVKKKEIFDFIDHAANAFLLKARSNS